MLATLTFEDRANKTTSVSLHGLKDPAFWTDPLTRLNALADAIQPYTNTVVREIRANVMTVSDVTSLDASSQEYLSGLHKALVTFEYRPPTWGGLAHSNEKKFMNLWIPAPNLANFLSYDEVGYRMSAEAAATLEGLVQTLTGNDTFKVLNAVLEYREGRSARPTTEGGYILFEDFAKRRQYMSVPDPGFLFPVSSMRAFAEALLTGHAGVRFTNCKVLEVGKVEPKIEQRAGDPTSEPGFDLVDHRSTLKFTWTADARRKFMNFTLPGIKDQYLTTPRFRDKARNVLASAGTVIAAALTDCYGSNVRDLIFAGGKADYKNLEAA